MARTIGRGELWYFRFAPPDKRRPVLVLSRPALLEVLDTAIVVPITSLIRGVPTEVELGPEDGLPAVSCANFTNILSVRKSDLRRFIGTARPEKMREACRALSIACACDR